MKNQISRYFLLCVALILGCGSVFGQNDALSAAAGDRYVISAKAGGVNFVEGTVTVTRKLGKSGLLMTGDKLEIGDQVSTAADGRAEILLNPGSFLRLGGNTRFEFRTTSLDDLQIALHAGSAILEVFAAEEFKVGVKTPLADFVVSETGVYRVDVLNQRDARIEVWEGSARTSGTEIRRGRVANAAGSGEVLVSKFDRDMDALDMWSKARSKQLSKISAKLKRTALRTSLMSSFLANGWTMYDSFGLWVYDPRFGGHCFLPFGHGWHSPYGHGYGNGVRWHTLPPVISLPPGNTGGGPSPYGTKSRASTSETTLPPFIILQQTMDRGIRGTDRGSYDSDSGSSPSYSPSSSSSSSGSSSSSSSATGAKSDPTGTKP